MSGFEEVLRFDHIHETVNYPSDMEQDMNGDYVFYTSYERLFNQYKLLVAALQPLVDIANAFDNNQLDDEARKYWGKDNEHENTTDPKDIILYQGRGGYGLLTLDECLLARQVLNGVNDD